MGHCLVHLVLRWLMTALHSRRSIPVTVTAANEELVYEVIFDDGSVCCNLLKQYILVS